MGGKGFPPAPTAIKLLKDVRPARMNKREALIPGAMPAPPGFLDEEALVEWLRIAPLLKECGLLTKVDRAGLTQYCIAWSEYVQSRCEGVAQKRRQLAFSQLLRTLTEFGLTPSSRSRIRVDPPEPLSDVDQFKRKHG